jgi:hypothetical protein
MNHFRFGYAIVLIISTAACATGGASEDYKMSGSNLAAVKYSASNPPKLEPSRKVDEQDCTKPFTTVGAGNLVCR